MSSLTNVLVVIFFFLVGSEEVKTSDVVGSLGAGREFSRSTVDTTGRYETTGDGSECCRVCNENHPDTEMITFSKYTSEDGERTEKLCKCLAPDPDSTRPPTTIPNKKFTEVCAPYSFDVEGGVGIGKRFVRDTVTRVRHPLRNLRINVEDSGVCCQICRDYIPEAKMIEYDTHDEECDCYDIIQGKKPATDATEVFSTVCN